MHHGRAARLIQSLTPIRICIEIVTENDFFQFLLRRPSLAGVLKIQHHALNSVEVLVYLGRGLLLCVRLVRLDSLGLFVPGFHLDTISGGGKNPGAIDDSRNPDGVFLREFAFAFIQIILD